MVSMAKQGKLGGENFAEKRRGKKTYVFFFLVTQPPGVGEETHVSTNRGQPPVRNEIFATIPLRRPLEKGLPHNPARGAESGHSENGKRNVNTQNN